jgi:alpha-glucosidase (family GH31 glycosyl hydrolase)
VVREPGAQPSFDIEETTDALTIATSVLTVRVQKNPVRLRVQGSGGRTMLEEPDDAGFVTNGERRRAQFELSSGTRFYGTGERGLDLNLHGERFRSYNQSIYGYTGPEPTMNINVPLLLTSEGYALFFDAPYPGTFDLGARNASKFLYEAKGGELSYYVLAGETYPKQLDRYTWLTGRPPMPPKWALGFLQSKYGYRTEQAARETVNQLRENDIPADGLILDLYWFEHMGDLDWDLTAFPNPSQMIEDFEDTGIKTLVITEPYITEPSDWFSETVQSGTPRAAQTPDGTAHRISGWWSCGGCDAVLSDLTHAPTRDWWKDRYAEILDSGVHGLWTDLGEPEVHPSSMQHAAGPADAVHNPYNLIWARTVHDVFSEQRPNRRLVNLTRSGYAGIQRYGVFTWSADVGRTFGGLSVQRPIMLNSTLSGLYYHSSDLGGFTGQTSPELYARWMQMGAFTPVARAHGIDNQPTEPWRLNSPAPSISRRYLKLRYRLLPYLYTMAYRAHDRGMPIVRPLFFENPDARPLASEDDAYLFGDSFLVAPVVEPNKREKSVPLPEGTWINYWTDEAVQGGRTVTVDAPLRRLPLFVREGAIVPMRPTAPDYVGHSVPDTLQLAVYPSADGGQFTLYEDDGHTRAYEQNAFAQTTFEHQFTTVEGNSTLEVNLGAAQGTFETHPDQRTYSVVTHRIFQRPRSVILDGQPLPNRESLSVLRQNSSGYAYEASTRRLHVQFGASTRTAHRLQVRGVQPAGSDAEDVEAYGLDDPAPHPVRSSTSIAFRLPERSRVTLAVYDVLGRRVATLIDDEPRGKGPYTETVNPHALGLTSGVYFCRLTVNGTIRAGELNRTRFQKTRKMVVVR